MKQVNRADPGFGQGTHLRGRATQATQATQVLECAGELGFVGNSPEEPPRSLRFRISFGSPFVFWLDERTQALEAPIPGSAC